MDKNKILAGVALAIIAFFFSGFFLGRSYEEKRCATRSTECINTGYRLLGDGNAITNCGDTIPKTNYRP